MKHFLLVLVAMVVACSSAESAGTKIQPLYEEDEMNCGAEGYECLDGRECIDSHCTPAWIEIEELVAWSGYCDSAMSTVGGKYQPPAPGL